MNCKIEYIAGTENTCARLLSRRPDINDPVIGAEPFEPYINENTFEVKIIDFNELNPKYFAGCNMPEKISLYIPDFDIKQLDMAPLQSK